MVRHLRSTGRPAVCAPVVNRDVNQLELGRRPWSSPTLDLGRRSRVEEREVDPESGDYGPELQIGNTRHNEGVKRCITKNLNNAKYLLPFH